MQKVLRRLSVPLDVVWIPTADKKCHGEIKCGAIVIYDCNGEDAWSTLIHECLEFKLQRVTAPYRKIINLLIDAFEEICYQEKEEFLENIPRLLAAINDEKGNDGQ
jgi:hypothetical protein